MFNLRTSRCLRPARYSAECTEDAFGGLEKVLCFDIVMFTRCPSHMNSFFCITLRKSSFHLSGFSLNSTVSVQCFCILSPAFRLLRNFFWESVLLIKTNYQFAPNAHCLYVRWPMFVRLCLVILSLTWVLENSLLPSSALKLVTASPNSLPSQRWSLSWNHFRSSLSLKSSSALDKDFMRCNSLYTLGATFYIRVHFAGRRF